ncbi:MAG: GNAT family N-acetyltransferase [Pseudomonadota bacterium]
MSDLSAPVIEISRAVSAQDVTAAKRLFQEYADFLGVDLRFQGFDEEIATFPAAYERLLIARVDGAPEGAVGLKRLEDGVCEMKRLYVRERRRGLSLGRRLSEALIDEARRAGYRAMRLDTLARLKPALRLYHGLGFRPIDAYYENPESDVIYMQLDLG